MKPDEINQIIAETQGWRRTQTIGFSTIAATSVVIDGWLVPGGGFAYEPPIYTEDWNELHDVVDGMTLTQLHEFAANLHYVTGKRIPVSYSIRQIEATKLEWCEAIIRTLAPERWKE